MQIYQKGRVGRQRAFRLSQKLDIGVKHIESNIYGTHGKSLDFV